MARAPRIDVAGVAQHVIQRGVNRTVCFRDDLDREFYLLGLRECAESSDCRVHAYVLMTNHVHLLVTGEDVGSVSAMMHALGTRYVRRFNDRHQRTGTLWEGRFKSSLVESESYLLTCYRYIEMNPVRARMVARPQAYPWSSVHTNALGYWNPLIHPHPVYRALGRDRKTRLAAYRALIEESLEPDTITSIRAHLNQGKPLGRSPFRRQIQDLVGRRVDYAPRGRPRKRGHVPEPSNK